MMIGRYRSPPQYCSPLATRLVFGRDWIVLEEVWLKLWLHNSLRCIELLVVDLIRSEVE